MPGRDGLGGSEVGRPGDGEYGVAGVGHQGDGGVDGDHGADTEGGVHRGGGGESVVEDGQDLAGVTALFWVKKAVEKLSPCLAAAGGFRAELGGAWLTRRTRRGTWAAPRTQATNRGRGAVAGAGRAGHTDPRGGSMVSKPPFHQG